MWGPIFVSLGLDGACVWINVCSKFSELINAAALQTFLCTTEDTSVCALSFFPSVNLKLLFSFFVGSHFSICSTALSHITYLFSFPLTFLSALSSFVSLCWPCFTCSAVCDASPHSGQAKQPLSSQMSCRSQTVKLHKNSPAAVSSFNVHLSSIVWHFPVPFTIPLFLSHIFLAKCMFSYFSCFLFFLIFCFSNPLFTYLLTSYLLYCLVFLTTIHCSMSFLSSLSPILHLYVPFCFPNSLFESLPPCFISCLFVSFLTSLFPFLYIASLPPYLLVLPPCYLLYPLFLLQYYLSASFFKTFFLCVLVGVSSCK